MSLSKSMTSGPPLRQIIAFAIPIMLGGLFQLIYSIVDSAVVGRLIGVEAFAAVGAAGNLNWMVFSIILGLTQGFGTVIAQHFGAGQHQKVKKSFAMSLLLSLGLGIVLSVLTVLLSDPVLRLLQTPQEIFADSSAYIKVIFGGLFITFFYNNLGASLRAVGNSRTPFYALVISSLLNVVLDIVLIKVTPWGVAAAAIATVISQAVSCVYCLYFVRKIEILQLEKEDFIPDRKMMLAHIRMGGPMGFRNFVTACGGTITQFYVNGYGTEFIAGIAATKRMYSVLELVSTGMDGAIATYVAQNYGAQRMDRIRHGLRQSAVVLLLGAGLIMAVMFPFGRNVMGLLISGDAEQLDRVLSIACEQLNLMLVFLPFLYMLYLFRSSLQGMDNALFPMLSGFIELGTRLIIIFTLPGLIGRWGIYLGEVVPWLTAMIFLCVTFFIVYFKRCREMPAKTEQHTGK